ncbi:hypothetical protein B0J18DRAFT_248452 [Chaetomium sp. MPI-SDFR-AT-0129]|nr:hypothetical protein B0J18DRAFT_248452 [Chaetomium sp. MPI-SDFR-AT-0129]
MGHALLQAGASGKMLGSLGLGFLEAWPGFYTAAWLTLSLFPSSPSIPSTANSGEWGSAPRPFQLSKQRNGKLLGREVGPAPSLAGVGANCATCRPKTQPSCAQRPCNQPCQPVSSGSESVCFGHLPLWPWAAIYLTTLLGRFFLCLPLLFVSYLFTSPPPIVRLLVFNSKEFVWHSCFASLAETLGASLQHPALPTYVTPLSR